MAEFGLDTIGAGLIKGFQQGLDSRNASLTRDLVVEQRKKERAAEIYGDASQFRKEDGSYDLGRMAATRPDLMGQLFKYSAGARPYLREGMKDFSIERIGGTDEDPLWGAFGIDKKGRKVALGDDESLFTMYFGSNRPQQEGSPDATVGKSTLLYADDVSNMINSAQSYLLGKGFGQELARADLASRGFAAISPEARGFLDIHKDDPDSEAATKELVAVEVIDQANTMQSDMLNKKYGELDQDKDGVADGVLAGEALTAVGIQQSVQNMNREELKATWLDFNPDKTAEDFDKLWEEKRKGFSKVKDKYLASKSADTGDLGSLSSPGSGALKTMERYISWEKNHTGDDPLRTRTPKTLVESKYQSTNRKLRKATGDESIDVANEESRRKVAAATVSERREWEAAREQYLKNERSYKLDPNNSESKAQLAALEEEIKKTDEIAAKYGVVEDTQPTEEEFTIEEVKKAVTDEATAKGIAKKIPKEEQQRLASDLESNGGGLQGLAKMPRQDQLKAAFLGIMSLPSDMRNTALEAALNIIGTGDPTLSTANVLAYNADMAAVEARWATIRADLTTDDRTREDAAIDTVMDATSDYLKAKSDAFGDPEDDKAASAFGAASENLLQTIRAKSSRIRAPEARVRLVGDYFAALNAKIAFAAKRRPNDSFPQNIVDWFRSADELNELSASDLSSRLIVTWEDNNTKSKIKTITIKGDTDAKSDKTLTMEDLTSQSVVTDKDILFLARMFRAMDLASQQKQGK